MTTRKKKRRGRRTARIYYGRDTETGEPLYWTVIVHEATSVVELNGSLADAILGTPGSTIGCHLSNCAKRNSAAFSHPCKLAAFTKSSCLIVTKIKNGTPVEAVRYAHSYGHLVELNDKDRGKAYIRAHPELAERVFRLRPPAKDRGLSTWKHTRRGDGAIRRTMIPRGALKRAMDAGLVSRGLLGNIAAI